MNDSSLKKKIRGGKLVLGSWITLGHTAIAEIMAHSGLDFVTVDLEHSTISINQAGELIRAIDLAGSAPLVRLSSNDPVLIKRVMDAGAHGIIVPMVNSADDARAAAQAMHYPPRGERGVGLARAQGYGTSFQDYRKFLDAESVLIVQIEHKDGVENLEEILAVEDVDGIIVGPYDLSASLHIPGEFDNPLMKEYLGRIESICKEKGGVLGTHVVEPDEDLARKSIERGYRFLAYTLDIRVLETCLR
ncbi:MAG: 2,4-dihydroxyhept-2-ene-1,7-dioic acid aldolase [Pseudodesulfovibrio sp.]|nr:2,4-dihydroxyhept-2-ene-1,7-dioic acid aldolase [Pseudodesulfovibrio sp.]